MSPEVKDRLARRLSGLVWLVWVLLGVGAALGGAGLWHGWVWVEAWGSPDVRIGASFGMDPVGTDPDAAYVRPWRVTSSGGRARVDVTVWRTELGRVVPYARHFAAEADCRSEPGPMLGERDAAVDQFIRSRSAVNPGDWPPGLTLATPVSVDLGTWRHLANALGEGLDTWPVRVGLTMIGGGLALVVARWRTRGWIAGRCPVCGYDLTGLGSGLCPECGPVGRSIGRVVE